MAETVRIPIPDNGWIEVPADDPRAIEYKRQWAGSPPTPAPAPSVITSRVAVNGIYTVQPGDTLSAIARDFLGDGKLYPALASLNQIRDPNHILVGQHLILPNRASPSNAGGGTGGTTGSLGGGPSSHPGDGNGSPTPPSNGAPTPSNSAPATMPASHSLARGFQFVFFEQLPEVGAATKIIRKVAIVPKNYAFPFGRPLRMPGVGSLWPRNPSGTLSPVEHVMNLNPLQSQFLSASDRAFASGSIEGTPLLIDVAKVRAAGGNVLTVDELVAELAATAAKNPASRTQMERLMWTVSKIEGEVLIRGGVPRGAATPITGPAHLGHIQSAEGLWGDFKAGAITRTELEQGLVDLERAYSRARVVGRFGRVFIVVGVVLTAYDLEQAGKRSFEQQSVKPISAEVIRQVGGWGGAAAGAKIGAVVGAAFGVETGPGAVVTGAIGAIVFGAAGYFGADWIADKISPN